MPCLTAYQRAHTRTGGARAGPGGARRHNGGVAHRGATAFQPGLLVAGARLTCSGVHTTAELVESRIARIGRRRIRRIATNRVIRVRIANRDRIWKDTCGAAEMDDHFAVDVGSIDNTLSRTIRAATQQSKLAAWYKCNRGDVSRISAIRANDPSLNARTQHMAPTATKGTHSRFDIPPSITVKHQPTSFLTSPLPYGADGLPSLQFALFLSFLLGLTLPFLSSPDGLCI